VSFSNGEVIFRYDATLHRSSHCSQVLAEAKPRLLAMLEAQIVLSTAAFLLKPAPLIQRFACDSTKKQVIITMKTNVVYGVCSPTLLAQWKRTKDLIKRSITSGDKNLWPLAMMLWMNEA